MGRHVRRSDREEQGAFLLQPRARLIDEGITSTSRPVRIQRDDDDQTRVWNTIAAVRSSDQREPHLGRSLAARGVAAVQPGDQPSAPPVTLQPRAKRDDVDQTVAHAEVGARQQQVNTLRVGWTQEDVSFGNPCFNGNGRDQAAAGRRWRTRRSPTSRPTPRRRASTTRSDRQHVLVVRAEQGRRPRSRVGAQCQYSQSRNDTQDGLNGSFSFGLNDIAFNTANPRTYPERFTIRVPGKGGSFNKSNYFAAFAQDKWKLNDRLTLSLGLRYDLEVIAINEIDNPLFGEPREAATILSTRTTSSRASAWPTTSTVAASFAVATAGSSTRRTSS